MTEENPLTIAELGAYTNNSMNREGLKKLVDKVNSGGEVDAYTKAETDALLATKQGTLTAGNNVAISEENVISATDTKYTAGTGISISDENIISAVTEGWTEVDVSTSQKIQDVMSTYRNTHDFMVITKEFNPIIAINKRGTITDKNRYMFGIIGGSDGRAFLSCYLTTSDFKLKIVYYNVGSSGSNTIHPDDIMDFDGTQITSTNIGNYIDTTTNKCIKPFLIKSTVVGVKSASVNMLIPEKPNVYVSSAITMQTIYDAVVNNTNISPYYSMDRLQTNEVNLPSIRFFVKPSDDNITPLTP